MSGLFLWRASQASLRERDIKDRSRSEQAFSL
jgi:hypothetical protein